MLNMVPVTKTNFLNIAGTQLPPFPPNMPGLLMKMGILHLLDGEYPFSWFASLWLMKMDQSLLKLKLEVEERIKDLSGEHLNTY